MGISSVRALKNHWLKTLSCFVKVVELDKNDYETTKPQSDATGSNVTGLLLHNLKICKAF